MVERLYKLPKVIELTTLSRPTIYRHIAKGTFPAPVKITEGRVAWRRAEVDAWIEERVHPA